MKAILVLLAAYAFVGWNDAQAEAMLKDIGFYQLT